MTAGPDTEVELVGADGWRLAGAMRTPPAGVQPVGGVVLVHGAMHERDAYGEALLDGLAAAGVTSLRFDIRGRGASRGRQPHHRMTPAQHGDVALDVAAALDHLGPLVPRMGVLAEQDTAEPAVLAAAAAASGSRHDVVAVALVSPRLTAAGVDALTTMTVPVLVLASKEDRAGLRSGTDAFLAGTEVGSRIVVLGEVGFGTTMFSARAFEQPDEEPLESLLSAWLAARLGAGATGVTGQSR